MWAILLLVLPFGAWVAPGWLLSRIVAPAADPLERGVLSLALGIATVTPLTWLATLAFAVPVAPLTILSVAAAVCLFAGLMGPRNAPAATLGALPMLLFAIAAAVGMSLLTTPYAIDTVDVFWHCPHLSSLYAVTAERPIVAWDPNWGREVTHLLSHPSEDGFGLGPVLAIQRAGNAAFVSQAFSVLSTGGFVVAMACADFLVLGGSMLLLRRHLTYPAAVAGLAIAVLVGVRCLASYQLNENTLALGLSVVVLHLALTERTSALVCAGLVMGHVAGIRPVTLALLPALLLISHKRLPVLVAYAAALSPWLITNGLTMGDIFRYPQLEAGRVEQTVMGLTFTFHPLNWPLNDAFLRPPGHPYPSAVRIPLEVIRSLGAPMIAAATAGLLLLGRQRAVAAVLWVLPVPLMLMAIVALDYQKMSYVLLALAPLPWLLGAGLAWLGKTSRRLRGAWLACMIALLLLPSTLAGLELQVDDRAHIDLVFDARDARDEGEVRSSLTAPSILPDWPQGVGFSGAASSMLLASGADEVGDVLPAPVVIWTALPPSRGTLPRGGLPAPFKMKTSKEPLIPPSYLGKVLPGAGPTSGRTLYLVALDDGPAEVGVSLISRAVGAPSLSLRSDGRSSQGTRWVTVLVVQRTRGGRSAVPTIALNGERLTTFHIATESDAWGAGGVAFPVVSNRQFGVDRAGLNPLPWPGDPITDGELECASADHEIRKFCPTQHCVWALTDRQGFTRRLKVPDSPGVSGSRTLHFGPAVQGPCVRQLDAIGR